MSVAAGVIGLAGDLPIPAHSTTGNNGVYGEGPIGITGKGETGVSGNGATGPGVIGISNDHRGGVFKSYKSAQARLVPKDLQYFLNLIRLHQRESLPPNVQ